MFCLAFKDIDGSPTSFSEQKDAFEFLSLFFDRVEEQIKGTKHADFIKMHFGGLISNELICKECPHSYEREEPFLAINLPVKGKKSIKASLESFIEGEVLEGDNAYECEECKIKVKTLKRTTFKKLPNYLFFVLKRFEYDFDLNIKVKVNDYCEFPLELNMDPYTQQYLKRQEKARKNTMDDHPELSQSRSFSEIKQDNEYTLKGVVIHLGIADSGHYYSIIKDVKEENGVKREVWIDFNDTKVSEFNIKDLPNIAYGERDGHPSYHNAYILVYERKHKTSELINLEKDFEEESKMQIEEIDVPEHIKAEREAIKEFQDELQAKNLRLFYVSNIFSQDYTKFISNLITNFEQASSAPTPRSKIPPSLEIMEVKEEDFNNTGKKSIGFKMFCFITTVYFTTIIRSRDKATQQIFFQWIVERMDLVGKKNI